MKSRVEEIPIPEAGPPTDDPWLRLTLEPDELLDALEEDGVRAFVASVLRTRYGTSPVFYNLVSDAVRSVLLALAHRLRGSINEHALAILFKESQVRKQEAAYRERAAYNASVGGSSIYWRGESEPVPEIRERDK